MPVKHITHTPVYLQPSIVGAGIRVQIRDKNESASDEDDRLELFTI